MIESTVSDYTPHIKYKFVCRDLSETDPAVENRSCTKPDLSFKIFFIFQLSIYSDKTIAIFDCKYGLRPYPTYKI
jgi:hypothetical protein